MDFVYEVVRQHQSAQLTDTCFPYRTLCSSRLGGAEAKGLAILCWHIVPGRFQFDKNDRRATLVHRAHLRREPDQAAAVDRDTQSRRTSEQVHRPALAR